MGPTRAGVPEGFAECVVNISEGRRGAVVAEIASSGGPLVLDVHSDAEHHRSVLTLAGPRTDVDAAAREVAMAAVERLDLRGHVGVHPRLGVVDVVPFVDLAGDLGAAVVQRDVFSSYFARVAQVPVFRYGPERSLPDVRRSAFATLRPDAGPPRPHPTAGATAVGARPVLVAYNVWIAPGQPSSGSGSGEADGGDVLALARRVAAEIRSDEVRALGLPVAHGAQVSCNLVAPHTTGPGAAYDAIARRVEAAGAVVVRAELVGLIPGSIVASTPTHRWAELDLDPGRTIESRLESAGLL